MSGQSIPSSPHSHTIKAFEGGRGLAALFVALHHLGLRGTAIAPVRNGYLFVDLFFTISGFVICAAYATKLETAANFRSFLIRRFGRLFPLLAFSTGLYVLAQNLVIWVKQEAVVHGYASQFEQPAFLGYKIPHLAEVLSTLTFTQGMGIFDRLILNPVSWSISTEFYAYVLFAVACLCFRGRIRLVSFALLGVAGYWATAWATAHVHDCFNKGKCFDITYDFGFARCVCSFLMGALMYHVNRALRVNASVQVAAVIGLAALFWLAEAFPLLTFATPLLFAVLVLAVCNDTGWVAALLKAKPLQVLGQRSYSVYMIHPVLMIFIEPFARQADGFALSALATLAYIAALVALSGWTYRVIENPLRKRFNRMAAGQGETQSARGTSVP